MKNFSIFHSSGLISLIGMTAVGDFTFLHKDTMTADMSVTRPKRSLQAFQNVAGS